MLKQGRNHPVGAQTQVRLKSFPKNLRKAPRTKLHPPPPGQRPQQPA